ncbi:unnamed protein product, partial [Meganyctiphanes norvegica]
MVQASQNAIAVLKGQPKIVTNCCGRNIPPSHRIQMWPKAAIFKYLRNRAKNGPNADYCKLCSYQSEPTFVVNKAIIDGREWISFAVVAICNFGRSGISIVIGLVVDGSTNLDVIQEIWVVIIHPENPEWTCFEQAASLDVKAFFGFESTVEKIAMKQYSQNITKGKEIIEHYLIVLEKEGITHVPLWEEPTPKKENKEITASPENDATKTVEETSEELPEKETEEEKEVVPTETEKVTEKLKKASVSSIDKDDLAKLDADYIKRCLGDLTPLQESRLIQLKKWVSELHHGKVPGDSMLLRFLRARDFNIEKARELLSNSLIWRKKNQVDKMMSNYQAPQVLKDYFPGGWHHHDKEGHPLYLLRLGQMDVKGLIKSVGEEGLLKHTLHICEEGLNLCEEATQNLGRPISTWTMLVDLEGLNMRHLWRPGIRTLLKVIEIVEANYPETMSFVLIIRAPRVFPILWTLVSTFIDENTRSKFLFYGGNDYQDAGGLIDYMPKEFIPDFLGGECTRSTYARSEPVPEALYTIKTPDELECSSSVLEGGLVPKSMYQPGEEFDGTRQTIPFSDQSMYHSIALGPKQVHEVVLLLEDAGSVICWDFDVMKSDVSFSVLRTKVPLTNLKEPQSPTGAMGVIDAVMGSDNQHKSHIEKTWREGHEYFRVEPTGVFHDGESIQGSHVTSHMGTYILQWAYHESPHHSPLDIIDSITAHKSKIMYYFEMLNSSDYKGSMTSLASCHSGFSSLSSNTNKSAMSAASSCTIIV